MQRALNHWGIWAVRLGLAALVLGLAAAKPAVAAEIDVLYTKKGTAFIGIDGDIEASDVDKFRLLTLQYPSAVVALNSRGGLLIPGLEIGRLIHLRGYATVVFNKDLCASSCALIWMAGSPRFLQPGGILGLHASYYEKNGKLVESGVANALIGHYLSQLNLPERAIVFAAMAPPDKLAILNESNRIESGIQFETFPLDEEVRNKDNVATPARQKPQPAPAPQKPQPALAPQLPQPQPSPLRKTPCGEIDSGACVPALTQLVIRIESPLSSRTTQSGELFRITLAEPIVIDGKTVLPAGFKGMGEVIHAKGTGFGARGELLLAARFIEVDGEKLQLRSLRVGHAGTSPQGAPISRDLATGYPAEFVQSQQIEIPAGSMATAKTALSYIIEGPETKPTARAVAPPATANPR